MSYQKKVVRKLFYQKAIEPFEVEEQSGNVVILTRSSDENMSDIQADYMV